MVSTDDAYVRANATTLGARVSGHVATIFAGDNTLVKAGEVVFKIDDGDYRIAVDAARTRIETQQATIDRIGRQITAQEARSSKPRRNSPLRKRASSAPVSTTIASTNSPAGVLPRARPLNSPKPAAIRALRA